MWISCVLFAVFSHTSGKTSKGNADGSAAISNMRRIKHSHLFTIYDPGACQEGENEDDDIDDIDNNADIH